MNTYHYGVSARDAKTLIYLGHEYQRKLGAGKTNSDDSVPWRCKQRLTQVQCKGTVTQLSSGDIKANAAHSENCPIVTKEDELNSQMKATCKKRCINETTSLSQIYREERAKMIKSSGKIEAVAEKITVIPYFTYLVVMLFCAKLTKFFLMNKPFIGIRTTMKVIRSRNQPPAPTTTDDIGLNEEGRS